MNRRTLLKHALVGGSGVALGWVAFGDQAADMFPPSSETPQGPPGLEKSACARIQEATVAHYRVPALGPEYDFEYGERTFDDVEHPAVDRIEARAAPERDGDRLGVTRGRWMPADCAVCCSQSDEWKRPSRNEGLWATSSSSSAADRRTAMPIWSQFRRTLRPLCGR